MEFIFGAVSNFIGRRQERRAYGVFVAEQGIYQRGLVGFFCAEKPNVARRLYGSLIVDCDWQKNSQVDELLKNFYFKLLRVDIYD